MTTARVIGQRRLQSNASKNKSRIKFPLANHRGMKKKREKPVNGLDAFSILPPPFAPASCRFISKRSSTFHVFLALINRECPRAGPTARPMMQPRVVLNWSDRVKDGRRDRDDGREDTDQLLDSLRYSKPNRTN